MYAEWIMMLAAAAIAARAIRLVTRDVLTDPIRRRIGARFDGTDELDTKGPVEAFVSCAWCIGWWITLVVFAAVYTVWPGHDWSASQLTVWAAAACASNIAYATAASISPPVDDLVTAAKLAMLGAGNEPEEEQPE